MRSPSSSYNKKIMIALGVMILVLAIALVAILAARGSGRVAPPPSLDGLAEFKAPPRTPDLSGAVAELAKRPPPSVAIAAPAGVAPPPVLPASVAATAQLEPGDPIMARLQRYGTPISKQGLPVGGLTQWTVVAKTGRPVQLYTTPDGQAVFSGVVWNLATGQNVSEQYAPPGLSALEAPAVPTAPPKSNLVSGKGALPAAFDGKAPSTIPEAIKVVDTLAGFKEGNGGPADTLYVIIDPRCPYCRRAFNATREYAKNGFTIKWIPTAALGNPQQGVPLATTILRNKDAGVVSRVLGGHEQIATQPTPEEAQQLQRNLDFMFDAFRQNNEPNPGVPVAFFIDRRTGNARMMMGLSESAVIEDILGQPNKKAN